MPSLLEALEQKYGDPADSSPDDDSVGISVAIFVPCKSPRAAVPALLVLNDCDIATAGERDALVAKCSNVEELDLAKNKLDQWTEVFGILEHMPRLKFVNLSFNSLSKPMEVSLDKRWEELRNLVLNSTHVNWESVKKILAHLPSLEELHLSLNDYNDVDLGAKQTDCQCSENKNDNCDCKNNTIQKRHSVIRILHFTGNPIANWKEISKLGYAFPNLESLVLAECPIKSLDLDEVAEEGPNKNYESETIRPDSPHEAFKFLKVLNLNSTNLSSWDDIERLAKFPALQCLRVQGCPLWEGNEYTEHERRQLFIARLPNVQTLNGGGVISADEREDAERAFIRYYMEKPESDRPERYNYLVQKHGKLDPLVNIDLRPEKRVKITFTCGSNSEVRSVDIYRTVSDLKTRLEGFAGIPASKMRLFYIDQELRDIQGPEYMRFPSKQLFSYNIRSGDEIIIVCKMENKRRTHSESKMSEKQERAMYNL
ncbi:tubulin-specific chaperone cofactor E-like protein [Anthonomus grandis grandis]|uniref:tubulin-specific chaperone cofactor E-like protein n=1 Tax=Anthonomus grandis grandis TaxID=2921223 RepID=UPI002165A7F7|nr:tubulin-specific chaperone cofactor E-like protein [Anthonomus grandis grandis]XP_050307721.1 tubulin-specific chaperone cofactor E-like protein [Anthonomus grandis grandis]XP_050307723.1 tubulin-specific chaperone cofactor E-like protein [Anthonomus grandis grandis]